MKHLDPSDEVLHRQYLHIVRLLKQILYEGQYLKIVIYSACKLRY